MFISYILIYNMSIKILLVCISTLGGFTSVTLPLHQQLGVSNFAYRLIIQGVTIPFLGEEESTQDRPIVSVTPEADFSSLLMHTFASQ